MAESITNVIGLDLSDRAAEACVLPLDGGDVESRETIEMSEIAMTEYFDAQPTSRVIMEAGTHSPWLSRLLCQLGHEVRVADPRRLKVLTQNVRKSDEVDAELLGRLERVEDLELIRTVEHRDAQLQADYALVKARDQLVKSRTALVNAARGLVKSAGGRLPSCSTETFARKKEVWEAIPPELRLVLSPMIQSIGQLTLQIKAYEKTIETVLETRYPDINRILRQIKGVGPITTLCFICAIQDPERFEFSRAVGAYVGMVPGRSQSGEKDPKKGITKTGDALLRCQLTRAANYIMTFGEDSDLRRFAERKLDEDKPRSVVACAVGRKLAVLMHRLWSTGADYEPLYQANRRSDDE